MILVNGQVSEECFPRIQLGQRISRAFDGDSVPGVYTCWLGMAGRSTFADK